MGRLAASLSELKKRLNQRWLDENRPDLENQKDPREEALEQDRMQEKYGSEQSDESCQNCGICDGVYEIELFNKWGDEHTYFFCGDGCEGQWMRENKMSYDVDEFDAESFKPPQSAVNNAKRGLELRKKWGRGGLSPSEAKSQGIDSGVTRARKIASGKVSTHDVRRMSAFNRHRKNYRPDKKMPDGGPTAGTIAWLLWGGTSGVNWAKKKSATMNAEDYEIKSHIWINDNPRKYSYYRCGCGQKLHYVDEGYFECSSCSAIWDGEKYLGLDDVWNYCKNCGISFEEGGRDEICRGEEYNAETFEADVEDTDRFMTDITCSFCGEPYDGTEVLDQHEAVIVHRRCAGSEDYEAEDYGVGGVWMADEEDAYDEIRQLGCPICAHELHTVSASAECPYCEVLWHYHEDDGFSYFEAEGDFDDDGDEDWDEDWEGDYDYEPGCDLCIAYADPEDVKGVDKSCEVCNMGLCEGCFGDLSQEVCQDCREDGFGAECDACSGTFSAEGEGGTQVFNSCWKCGSGLHLYQITRYPATPDEISGVGGDPSQASDAGRARASGR